MRDVKQFIEGRNLWFCPLRFVDLRYIRNLRNEARHAFTDESVVSWSRHLLWWWSYRASTDQVMFVLRQKVDMRRRGVVSLYDIGLDSSVFGRLVIDPRYRQHGYGREAVVTLCAYAHALGNTTVWLSVRPDNVYAIRLYESCGFRTYTDDDPAMHMMKYV